MNGGGAASPLIGIRDSGVGGLTVTRRIREKLPHASLLYFADTAHVPYGDRSPQEVRHFALSISEFLLGHGAQLLVFACNTSSAYALETAQERFPVPVIGMIEPGARAALEVCENGLIGVLATQATVESDCYPQAIQRLRPGTEVLQVACPEFVPLVENEQSESVAAQRACRHRLAPLRDAGVKTVVLGCTHYPLLLPVLQEAAPEINFVDPAEAVACEVAALHAPLTGHAVSGDVFYVSGLREGVEFWIEKLLGETAPDVRRGPVFDLPLE